MPTRRLEWIGIVACLLMTLFIYGCAGTPNYAEMDWHGKDYPCPPGTIKVGDPRFGGWYSCERH